MLATFIGNARTTISTVSNVMTVLVVAGTRPEVIKLAPVVEACKAEKDLRTLFCLTGQHRELADDVVAFFGLNVDYRLDVMRKDQDLSGVTSRVLSALQPVLQARKPDIVVVQGDTVTCFAASLAAFFQKIPVCHVEAGLRTYDLSAPFPEEALRQMVTRITSLHCAATAANRDNLLAEGISETNVVVTGNTVIDALYRARDLLSAGGEQFLKLSPAELARIETYGRFVLITGHRRENFGDKLASICQALATCAAQHPDVLFVYPIHPNPNVLTPVRKILGSLDNVMLLGPLNYPDFIYLMNRCHLVVTDSGGIQEEAPALGKPVIVTRHETERQEAVATGQVVLAGTSMSSIGHALEDLLCSPDRYAQMSRAESPYGDGKAAGRISSSIMTFIRDSRSALTCHIKPC
jgi:UDP-N-acetylglucosamine 2-epimerase (non-hydrolysing)